MTGAGADITSTPFPLLLKLLLLAAVLAAFAPGLDNDLVGDDLEWARFAIRVSRDPGLIFSLFSGFVTPTMNLTVGLNALASADRAWSYNLTGLLLHLLNVLMLFRLVRILSRNRSAAWWSALWWGLHYRHDEAVLWLGGRPHVLVITGILAALLAQRRWIRHGEPRALAACLAAGIFAILSKESGVMVAPLALLWVAQVERRPPRMGALRSWSGAAGLCFLAGTHGLFLWLVREGHQFYYRLDWSWLGRLAGLHLQAAGIPVPDPAPVWLILPALAAGGILYAAGGRAVRFGLIFMLLGALPVMLIEFQPPRYRYFLLAGAAMILAGALRHLLPRWRKITVAAMVLLCAWLFTGVRNDEVYLDRAGEIHGSLRQAFCASVEGQDRDAPLLVAWRPALRGVEALRETANRDLLLEVRNFPPIYVRANGLEGLAEAETLYALCEAGELAARATRLEGEAAADALAGGAFGGITYEAGRFLPMDDATRARYAGRAAAGSPIEGAGEGWRLEVLVAAAP